MSFPYIYCQIVMVLWFLCLGLSRCVKFLGHCKEGMFKRISAREARKIGKSAFIKTSYLLLRVCSLRLLQKTSLY